MDGVNVGIWRSPLKKAPCRNCMSAVEVPMCSSDADWPDYKHGGENTIKINPQQNEKFLLSSVFLLLPYFFSFCSSLFFLFLSLPPILSFPLSPFLSPLPFPDQQLFSEFAFPKWFCRFKSCSPLQ